MLKFTLFKVYIDKKVAKDGNTLYIYIKTEFLNLQNYHLQDVIGSVKCLKFTAYIIPYCMQVYANIQTLLKHP